MKDINEEIEKYLEYKDKYSEIEKKIEKYKSKIKNFLVDSGKKKYESPIATVTIQTAKKNTISKKDTPDEIWTKYSKETSYDILNVRKKK